MLSYVIMENNDIPNLKIIHVVAQYFFIPNLIAISHSVHCARMYWICISGHSHKKPILTISSPRFLSQSYTVYAKANMNVCLHTEFDISSKVLRVFSWRCAQYLHLEPICTHTSFMQSLGQDLFPQHPDLFDMGLHGLRAILQCLY